MFVNVHVFLVTMSFNIKSSSAMNIQGRGATKAESGLKITTPPFTAHKINIDTIFGDNKIESVRKALIPVLV